MSKKSKTKQELLESIQQSHQLLEKKYANLTPEQMIWPGSMNDWSVKDILAHLVDWEQRLIDWYQTGVRGDLPKLNQTGYEKHKLDSLDTVLKRYRQSYQEIFDLVLAMTEQEIFETGYYQWTGNSPLLSWIAANTSSHYAWGRRNIRTTVIRKGCP
jgi:hypothetical protein